MKQIGVTKHVRFCTLAVLDLRNSADPISMTIEGRVDPGSFHPDGSIV